MPESISFNKAPKAAWDHFQGVLANNFKLGKKLRDWNKIEKGISGFDQVAKTRLKSKVTNLKREIKNGVKPALPHPDFFDRADKTHHFVMLLSAPFGIHFFAKQAHSNFKKAALETSSRINRFYHCARGLSDLSIATIIFTNAIKDTALFIQMVEPQTPLLKFCDGVSKYGFHIFQVLSVFQPIAYALEVYQVWNVTDLTQLDPTVMKNCFGLTPQEITSCCADTEKKALLDKQLTFYRRIKMVQTANAVADLVTGTFLTAIPATQPFALMGLVVILGVKLGTEFWIERRVTHLRHELGLKPKKSDCKVSKVARIVSTVATPFLSVAKTAPFAIGVIAVSVVVDIGAHVYTKTRSTTSSPS